MPRKIQRKRKRKIISFSKRIFPILKANTRNKIKQKPRTYPYPNTSKISSLIHKHTPTTTPKKLFPSLQQVKKSQKIFILEVTTSLCSSNSRHSLFSRQKSITQQIYKIIWNRVQINPKPQTSQKKKISRTCKEERTQKSKYQEGKNQD